MKPIEAKNQVALGPARCLQLALTGMSYRMFRAGVTIAILGLAVAFLVHMLAYGLMSRKTRLAAYEQLASNRRAGRMVSRLTSPDGIKTILTTLGMEGDLRRISEYRTWSGASAAKFEQVRTAARAGQEFADYLDDLPTAGQAVLIGQRDYVGLLAGLQDAARWRRFKENLQRLDLPPPMGNWQRFQRLVTSGWPEAVNVARSIRQGHAQAIAEVRQAYPGRSARDLLENPPDGLISTLHDAGFEVEPGQLEPIGRFVRRANDLQTISRLVTVEQVRQAVARATGMPIKKISSDRVLAYLTSRNRATWFARRVREAGGPKRLDAERLLVLSKVHRRDNRLRAAVGTQPPTQAPAFMGLSATSLYLIGLSFVVCIVGVANAMFMSVTERFAEIATMKCLGAMDRFVMMMFVFEAAIQGVVGGVVGVVIGLALALLRGLFDYGSLLTSASAAVGQVSLACLAALVVGVMLATFAAVGPSFVAARLAPMEAMRVE